MSRQLENYGINILKLHAEWLLANGYKQQASSLTMTVGYNRMDLERNNMEKITIDYRVSEHMKRIADALEEILRLVKQDMQKYEKKKN